VGEHCLAMVCSDCGRLSRSVVGRTGLDGVVLLCDCCYVTRLCQAWETGTSARAAATPPAS